MISKYAAGTMKMTPAFSVFHQSGSEVSHMVSTSPSAKGSCSSSPPSYVYNALVLVAMSGQTP